MQEKMGRGRGRGRDRRGKGEIGYRYTSCDRTDNDDNI